jgi:hypothetical protein
MKTRIRILFVAGALALTLASTYGAAYAGDADAAPVQQEAQVAQVHDGLDLSALEDRLRGTTALSFMGKLALKSEIDALMARFRLAHAGKGPGTRTLRQPYDTLLTKIRTSLKRNDPQLAREIAVSREAIWEVLSDRARFPA